mmetsp:Transcript_13409/g.39182  ORF Transcript_13409/g.39182 Transcript_13409/m.39182 type:complete len:307 (+) Transcript_13409:338-1258(+)
MPSLVPVAWHEGAEDPKRQLLHGGRGCRARGGSTNAQRRDLTVLHDKLAPAAVADVTKLALEELQRGGRHLGRAWAGRISSPCPTTRLLVRSSLGADLSPICLQRELGRGQRGIEKGLAPAELETTLMVLGWLNEPEAIFPSETKPWWLLWWPLDILDLEADAEGAGTVVIATATVEHAKAPRAAKRILHEPLLVRTQEFQFHAAMRQGQRPPAAEPREQRQQHPWRRRIDGRRSTGRNGSRASRLTAPRFVRLTLARPKLLCYFAVALCERLWEAVGDDAAHEDVDALASRDWRAANCAEATVAQ